MKSKPTCWLDIYQNANHKSEPVGFERILPGRWDDSTPISKHVTVVPEWTIANQFCTTLVMLRGSIDIHPEVCSGLPAIKNTRFPLSRLFAEIANNLRVVEIADEYDLDPKDIESLINKLADALDRPFIFTEK